MFDILFVRTFSIVGGMLLITAAVSTFNKDSLVGRIAGILVTLAIMLTVMFFRDHYPVNLVLLAVFSAWFGWMLGPLMNMISESGRGNAVSQALVCTAASIVGAWWIGMFSGMDFGFLKGYLALALFMLIVFSLLNSFWLKSPLADLVLPYIGSMLFVLYLIYDFNRLQKIAWDRTWWAAVDISMSLYLDILNLFLNLLEIFLRASGNR